MLKFTTLEIVVGTTTLEIGLLEIYLKTDLKTTQKTKMMVSIKQGQGGFYVPVQLSEATL